MELDGRDITKLNVHWLRRNIGIVSQEPVLFGCSIRDNIRLGNPTVTDEDIIQAATEANAHKFISSLPKVGRSGALHASNHVFSQIDMIIFHFLKLI